MLLSLFLASNPTRWLRNIICLTLLMGVAPGPADAMTMNVTPEEALNTQQRLSLFSQLKIPHSTFSQRLSDGDLGILYQQLQEQVRWTQSLQPFLFNKTPAVQAQNNLQSLITDVQSFYGRYIEKSVLGDPTVYENPELIVILGANRATLEQRLALALPLIQRFDSIPVVLSGGGRTVELESGIMRDFLLQKGVSASRLISESDSLDTVGNAIFTSLTLARRQVLARKILLVTSDFHAPRSLLLFQKIFGSDYQFAVALVPYSGSDKINRIDNELRQQATSLQDLLQWSPVPGRTEGVQNVKGNCSVLLQMVLRHALYTSRWDLPRQYHDVCSD